MKTVSVTLLVHAGLLWHFHNPLKFDIDYRIFDVPMCIFLHVYTDGGFWFIVSSEEFC